MYLIFGCALPTLSQQDIDGKWYPVWGGEDHDFTISEEENRGLGWYKFSPDNKIEYQYCTDMCGCIPEKLIGTHEWKNDSVILVHFTKKHRSDSYENKEKTWSHDEKLELQLKRKNDTVMEIKEYQPPKPEDIIKIENIDNRILMFHKRNGQYISFHRAHLDSAWTSISFGVHTANLLGSDKSATLEELVSNFFYCWGKAVEKGIANIKSIGLMSPYYYPDVSENHARAFNLDKKWLKYVK